MTPGAPRRIAVALTGLVIVTVVGTLGYLALGFTLLEAVYQTVTTVATVGFREVRPLGPEGMVFTIALIVLGVGWVLYSLGVVFEAPTEGHLRAHLERRRMNREIESMHGHVVICGHGRVGRAAREHLVAAGVPVVVVDNDPARLAGLTDAATVTGDVTDDAVLKAAGVERAGALVAALDTDADTVYVTLSARALRPDLVIVTRARTAASADKMVMAGATHAVNPQGIGGRRLAVFAMQPDVAEFLDVVMHEENLDFRLQQVHVAAGSALEGSRIGDLELSERGGPLLLALRPGPGEPLGANPAPVTALSAGAVLILLGTPEQLAAVSRLGASAG